MNKQKSFFQITKFFFHSNLQYDSTGKEKTSGFVSTAEGEDQTVNGKSSGYRAATTTIEDDGKRSTYSIHTP